MILAIDPGLTTGWATFASVAEPGFQSGMITDRHCFYDWFYSLMHLHYNQPGLIQQFSIVMERFTITEATARKSPQPDPLWIIGHIEAIAHRDGIPFEFQTPSQAMSFATNDKLKAIGWYKPGAGHDNDAARHLLVYLLKNPEVTRGEYQRTVLRKIASALDITLALPDPVSLRNMTANGAGGGMLASAWPRA